MATPNKKFELDVADLDLIEDALRATKHQTDDDRKTRAIHDLLGRLHNQKVFYRPSQGSYVGG